MSTAAVVLALCGLISAPALAIATSRAHDDRRAPLGGVNIVGLGFGARPSEADADITLAKQLHATAVRTELLWSVLEPNAAGQLDPHALAFVDRLMGDAARAGVKVIVTVRSTPCWDSSAPASLMSHCSPRTLTAANSWPPRDLSQYARIVGFIAHRYASALAAIEIWNEPDQANQLYFAGPEKPARYAALLRAAYPAIKQADPAVQVLAGSLVGANGAFLRAMYAAGIKGFYDALAIHYYNLTLGSVRAIREVQVANGDTKPLWLDEFGWSSCWPRERLQQEQACVTGAIQGLNAANIVRSLSRTPYIGATVIYDLRDGRRENFGLLTRSDVRKQSFRALAGALRSPFAAPSRVTLHLRRHGGRVLASGSAPVGDYMGLEAFQGSVLRYRALFTLNRFNGYSIPLPRVLGTHGLQVRVFQYWAGLARAAHARI